MTTVLNDPSTLPVSPQTRSILGEFFGHVIDGKVVTSLDGGTMPVIDPATELQIATAADGSAADVDRAVRSARAAFDDGRWRYLAPLEREKRLRKMADLVADRFDVFVELDVLDAGLLRSYVNFIVQFAVNGIEYYAGWPSKLTGSIPPVPHEFQVEERREPIGVCGMIMPWNGPTACFAFISAALAAGNSVVFKPAEQTPLSAVLMGQIAVEAGIPEGVFNVVQGTGEKVGAALVEHPEVDSIGFTGSVATGRAIQRAAAERLKRVTLELGGKSPVLIFPDANLDVAVPTTMFGVWGATGQVCTCGTRVLVHESIHDEVVERIVQGTKSMKIGPGLDETSEMGPLVSGAQLARVQSYVEIGKQEGAEVALDGGRWGDRGFFHEPVVFTGVRNDMRIAREEIFGPVMSILPFANEGEAYSIANDTDYGLAAGVWTENLSRAQRATRALRVGTVWINNYQMGYPTVPYGGVKQSGFGRTLGEHSLDEFTQRKSVWTKVD